MGRRLQGKAWVNDFDFESDGGGACRPRPANSAPANILLEAENEQGPLRKLLAAFKAALIHDLDEDGFADMYAQTIAYGLLAARISRRSGELTADDAALLAPPTNPFLIECSK